MHDEQNKLDVYISRDHLNTAFDRDLVEVKLYASYRGKNREGFVTKIIKRFRNKFVGTFHLSDYYGYVVPDDPRIYRDFLIPKEKRNEARDGQKVVVELTSWSTDHLNPEGVIVDVLGFPGEKGVDVASVAHSFQLNLKFPQQLLEEAKAVTPSIPLLEIKKRPADKKSQTSFRITLFLE